MPQMTVRHSHHKNGTLKSERLLPIFGTKNWVLKIGSCERALRAIKLNWLPTTPFLVYMHGTCLPIGKPFIRKQYDVLVFLINCAKSMEVPIELAEDYYCDLSVPIPNRCTIQIFAKLKPGLHISLRIASTWLGETDTREGF